MMITVSVVYAATRGLQVEVPLTIAANCTVALAVQRCGLLQQFPEIQWGKAVVGIYGQRVALDALLQDGDRIEIYRSLVIDPKQARRARVRR